MSAVRIKQVIRQGTFDTDPDQTLRSKSGGIKRGSLALPVIDPGPGADASDIKERSLDSLTENDKLSVVVLSDTTLKAKKRKTENQTSTKTAKDLPINNKDEKQPDKKLEPKKIKEVNNNIPKSTENNKLATANGKQGPDKKANGSDSTLKLPNKESKTKELREKLDINKKDQYVIDETRYEKVDLDVNSEIIKPKSDRTQLKQKGDKVNTQGDKKYVTVIDSVEEPNENHGNKKHNKKSESENIVLEPRNAKQRKVLEKVNTKPETVTNLSENGKSESSHNKGNRTDNSKVIPRSAEDNQTTKKSRAHDKESSRRKQIIPGVSDDLIHFKSNTNVSKLPPNDTVLRSKQGSTDEKKSRKSELPGSTKQADSYSGSDKNKLHQKKDFKESVSPRESVVFEKVDKTNSSHHSNHKEEVISSIDQSSSVTASKVEVQETSTERYLNSSLSIRSKSRSRSVERHNQGNVRVQSPENFSLRGQSPEKTLIHKAKRKSSIMEPSAQRAPASDRMLESYDSVYAERQTLLEAEATYKKRIKQLEDEMNQFLRTIEDLRSENKQLRSQVDEYTEKNRNPDHQGSTDQQSKTTIVIDTEKEELKSKIDDLARNNKDLTLMLNESSAKQKLTVSENEQLQEEIERLRKIQEAMYNETQGNVTKFQDDSAKLKDENERVKAEAESLRSNYDKLKTEVDKSKEEEVNAKQDVEKMKEEVERITKDLQDSQRKLDSEIADKEKKIQSELALQSDIEALKLENKKVEAELEKYKEISTPRTGGETERKSPNSENMELKAQIIALQTENQKINEEVIKMKAEHLADVKKIHDLEKASVTFQQSVTSVESEKLTEIQKLQNENSDLKVEIKTLNEAIAQKKKEVNELMVVMKEEPLENEMKELNDTKVKLTKELEIRNEEIEKCKNEIKELKLEHDRFEAAKKTAEDNIKSITILSDKKDSEINDLQEKLEKARKELEEERKRLESLDNAEQEIAEAKEEANKLSKDMENVKVKYEKEVQDMKDKQDKDNNEWKEKYLKLEKESKQEVKRLKEEISQLKQELKGMEAFKTSAYELEETRQELLLTQKKISKMTIELDEKSQIEVRNFELTLKLEQMNKKVNQLEKEGKELSVQKEKMEELESDNARLTEENEQLKQTTGGKGNIDTKLKVLERKQKDAETRVKQLEGWVGNLYQDEVPSGLISRVSQNKETHDNKDKKPYSKATAKDKDKKKSNKRPRSLEDVEVKVEKEDDKLTHSSTPSLPNIFDRERNPLTFGLGYAQIYRKKKAAAAKAK